MEKDNFIYGDKHVSLNSHNDKEQLLIDEQAIPLEFNNKTNKYIATQHSPYIGFDSVTELAKHIIDNQILDK